MFIVNQYTIPVSLTDVAATANADPVTGIAVNGPYNGAITAIDVAGVQTIIAIGDGVMPLVAEQATFIPFNVVCNYYIIDLQNAVVVGGRPHVFKLTHYNLHISDYETVLDYRITSVKNATTSDIVSNIPAVMCNYDSSSKAFFVTIPNAAIANYTNTKNLILAVVYGRSN